MKATPKKAGCVYILSNPDMPNIVKVGFTTDSPYKRAEELSRATGVASPYMVKHSFKSNNACQDEKKAHRALSSAHYSKEFFRCSVKHAIDTLEVLTPAPICIL